MTGAEVFVLVLILVAIALFATERLPVDSVGLLVLVALVLGGVLTPREAIAGFGNPALVAVGALFVVSEGVVRTGAVGYLSLGIVRLVGGRKERVIPLVLALVLVSSAFINNTPIVVIFIPIALGLAERFDFSPSKILMSVSFASLLGGMCTLIGTSTNLLINSLAASAGFAPLGMFEFLPVGLAFAAVGWTYMVYGQRLLPSRKASARLSPDALKEYLTEIRIGAGSSHVGRTLAEAGLASTANLRVLQLIRGERIFWPPLEAVPLAAGDVLIVKGELATVARLLQAKGVEGPSTRDEVRGREWTLAEAVLPPHSRLVGRTLERATFRKHYGVAVLAIQRAGEHVRSQIAELPLKPGDVLLVEGDPEQVASLRGERDLLLLESAAADAATIDTRRAPIATAILCAVVVLASVSEWPMEILALAGALAMVLTRCLSNSRAYQSVSWDILVLIGCMIALGRAMETTGLARTLAQSVGALANPLGDGVRPYVVLSLFYLVCTVISNFVSNNAAAVLLVPIALETARTLGVNERPFLFAVVYGVSASFVLPLDNTHLLVYGPGGYKLMDFVRFGAPLNVALWVVASVLLPIVFPF